MPEQKHSKMPLVPALVTDMEFICLKKLFASSLLGGLFFQKTSPHFLLHNWKFVTTSCIKIFKAEKVTKDTISYNSE
jgi:hypothetical protein